MSRARHLPSLGGASCVRLGRPLLLGVLACCLGDAGALPRSTAASSASVSVAEEAPGPQAFVIACNGYAHVASARVGVRPLPRHRAKLVVGTPGRRHGLLRGKKHGHGRFRRQHLDGQVSMLDEDEPESSEPEASPGRRAVAASTLHDALWSRPLAFGECAEYHIDLHRRQLFFVTPGGGDVCKLSQTSLVKMSEPDLDSDDAAVAPSAEELPARFAIVLSQAKASAPTCSLQTQVLTHRLSRYGGAAAELAVLDAYSQSGSPEEFEIDGENATLPPLDASAVLRLEDVVGPETIASETLASRTLGLGAEYAIEPKAWHVILEDMGGSDEFGHQDVAFRSNHTYVAVRMGRSGDKDFPARLVFHEVQEEDES
eukprot:TRINITY_DN92058_c0_g1_i1.p1 TRINITY_DN92058_c0_g1~~TRINITY_DN92058_c0_g1_i1.p1  ORF type:complete len:372 (+),score=76.82 TRINITY_DN92058_c0_g1_i1:84-1199(+)